MATTKTVTIDPASNDLVLGPADVLDESIKVTVPEGNRFRTMRLVPSASIAPFVGAAAPAGGYGPSDGREERTFTFRVQFHGIACTAEPQVATGTLDLVVDDQVQARKDVRITVPACAPARQVFAVKFVCGEQADCGCACAPLRPGRYATEINLHNYGLTPVTVGKRFVPLVLAGAPVGREPRVAAPRAEDRIVLPPQSATFDDCCRIVELSYGGAASGAALPLTVGWLEITADGPLAVTAVYTAGGADGTGVSIDVAQIAPRRL